MTTTDRDIVRAIARALSAHRQTGVCADGPDCLWCPAETIAAQLIDAGLVQVTP